MREAPKVPTLKTAGDVVAALGSNTMVTNAVVWQVSKPTEALVQCYWCEGTGYVDENEEFPCEGCYGRGQLVLCDACNQAPCVCEDGRE